MEGGRGLLSIADCVETEEQNLSLYLDQSEERLLRLSKSDRILLEYEEPVSTAKEQFHGKFVREKEEVRSEETWGWIRKGYLKKETEGLIFAGQEQALRTNWIRKRIDGQEVSAKCRMCGERDKSITHMIAECKKVDHKE